jgi:hypothetical protein
MQFPWSPRRSNSADAEAGDVAMQDIPRPSTETQRRNGFRQSANPDLGERIIEDIRNGQ